MKLLSSRACNTVDNFLSLSMLLIQLTELYIWRRSKNSVQIKLNRNLISIAFLHIFRVFHKDLEKEDIVRQ